MTGCTGILQAGELDVHTSFPSTAQKIPERECPDGQDVKEKPREVKHEPGAVSCGLGTGGGGPEKYLLAHCKRNNITCSSGTKFLLGKMTFSSFEGPWVNREEDRS